jgi:hypothetical protein
MNICVRKRNQNRRNIVDIVNSPELPKRHFDIRWYVIVNKITNEVRLEIGRGEMTYQSGKPVVFPERSYPKCRQPGCQTATPNLNGYCGEHNTAAKREKAPVAWAPELIPREYAW